MRLLRFAVLALMLWAAAPVTAQDSQPPRTPQDEYVPIEQLPPQEELAAAPMVIAAYSFVWVAFLLYMFSLVKRVGRVEADLRTLEQRSRR